MLKEYLYSIHQQTREQDSNFSRLFKKNEEDSLLFVLSW